MTTTKRFHIGTLLSILDGKLVAPNHIDDMYAICDWVTGDRNYTHQLPRVSREIEPILRKQFPDLAAVRVPTGLNSEADVIGYLASLEAQYGTHRDVAPMSEIDHTAIDPVDEIHMLNPNASVVTVDAAAFDSIEDAAARAAEALKKLSDGLNENRP